MTTIKIAAVGDILMWRRQIETAKRPGGFSFAAMFQPVTPLLKEADLVIGNLETVFGGPEEKFERYHPRTHYPMFSCPDELATALRQAGFDLLTTANNHCLDCGPSGLARTLTILDQQGIKHTGTFRSAAEAEQDLIVEVKGVKVGVLAYTYRTNVRVPTDQPWRVNLIGATMLGRIRRLKRWVDLTVVCLHFGSEFYLRPDQYQRTWVEKCFTSGADIVLGSHPHTLQPLARPTVKDSDGVTKDRFVAYSLGNFISKKMLGFHQSLSGVILNLTVAKDDQGKTVIAGADYTPTWVYGRQSEGRTVRYTVLPISQYLRDKGKMLPSAVTAALQASWEDTTKRLGGKPR